MNRNEPSHVTVAEAIAAYRIGRTKLYDLLGNGSITAVKLGRRTFIKVASLESYIADLPAYRGRA